MKSSSVPSRPNKPVSGHQRLNRILSIATIAERVASWESLYSRHGSRYGLEPSKCARETEPILQAVNSIVELACGYGRDLGFFTSTQPELRAVGIDSSISALKLAEQLAPRAEFVRADLVTERLALQEEFDAVYSNFCFHLFTEVERNLLFRLSLRLLRQGGQLISNFISTSDHFFSRGRPLEESTFLTYPDRFWHFFKENELVQLCRMHDLRIKRLVELTEREQIDDAVNEVTFWYLVAEKVQDE